MIFRHIHDGLWIDMMLTMFLVNDFINYLTVEKKIGLEIWDVTNNVITTELNTLITCLLGLSGPFTCLLGLDHTFHVYWALVCLLYTSPSPRDVEESRMPSSA